MKNFFLFLSVLCFFSALQAADLVTKSGRKFYDYKVSKAFKAGVQIIHSKGISVVPFADLSDELRDTYSPDLVSQSGIVYEDYSVVAVAHDKMKIKYKDGVVWLYNHDLPKALLEKYKGVTKLRAEQHAMQGKGLEVSSNDGAVDKEAGTERSSAGNKEANRTFHVSGRGKTEESAVLDALMQAVIRKNRFYVSDEKNIVDGKFSEKKVIHSFGRIPGFEILDSQNLDGAIEVRLRVSFKKENQSAKGNRVSTLEIWNLAQQLKYFNAALEQIRDILNDSPLRAGLKKYSVVPDSKNNDSFTLKQEFSVNIDTSLYKAQMSALTAILDIYCERKTIFGYRSFKANRQTIIAKNSKKKKIYITDAFLDKTTEYIVKEQFFNLLRYSLGRKDYIQADFFDPSESSLEAPAGSEEGVGMMNPKGNKLFADASSGKWKGKTGDQTPAFTFTYSLDQDKTRYYIVQNNEIMFFPVFCRGSKIGYSSSAVFNEESVINTDRIKKSVKFRAAYKVCSKGSRGSSPKQQIADTNSAGVRVVTVTGYGESPAVAEKDALSEAVRAVCGSAVISRTLVLNDMISSESLTSRSFGMIQKYEVMDIGEKQGVFFCSIKARVNVNELFVLAFQNKKYSIDLSPIINAINAEISLEESGRVLAREMRKWRYSLLTAVLSGKPAMGPKAKITGEVVSGLTCGIRLGVDCAGYRKMIKLLRPLIVNNSEASHKVDLYGRYRDINAVVSSFRITRSRSAGRRRRSSYRRVQESTGWNFAIVQISETDRPLCIEFYRMPEKFMEAFKKSMTEQMAKSRRNKVQNNGNDSIVLSVKFFNGQNKILSRSRYRLKSKLPVEAYDPNNKFPSFENSAMYVFSPGLYGGEFFKNFPLSLSINLNDLKGDLDCFAQVLYGPDDPKFDDFSSRELGQCGYEALIDRRSPYFGHEWYYLQEYLKRYETLEAPVSEYAVYYAHVVDNLPLGQDWRNGGLGFVPAVRTVDGAFEVLAMSPYAPILQGDKVYSFNGKKFSDVKEFFAWLKTLPPGEKIRIKTARGEKTIVLPPAQISQAYWQALHPANAPLAPAPAVQPRKGGVDRDARALFDRKKYFDAWNMVQFSDPYDIELMEKLADFYCNSKEVQHEEKDLAEKIAAFAKSKGSARGAYLYALCSLKKDKAASSGGRVSTETFRLFKEAAEMGDDDARNVLGFLLMTGNGCTKDTALALSYFKQAAAKNNAIAEYNVGIFYENSRKEKDKFKAVYWLRRSAEHGFKQAAEKLKSL